MSGSIILQISILVILVIINGVFAMSEIAIISSRKSRLQQRAEMGDARARVALELAESPNRFLSTIQIGITLVGVLAGAFGGATIGKEIGAWLDQFPALARYGDAIGVVAAVIFTTYLSLVLGELVPKRLGLQHSEGVARLVAGPMRTLSRLAFPIVYLLTVSTEAVLRLFGIHHYAEPPVTEEEIEVLVEQGTVAGMIEEVEREMVSRIFRLGERQVDSLMRPRTEVVWLDVDASPEEIREAITTSSYSRFPVCRGNLDEVLGLVQVKDLLEEALAGKPLDLRANLSEPLFVPESMRAFRMLELFKQAGQPIALVVDEYGVFVGLVTLNDVLEAIVGDIPELDEGEEPMAVQREDGSWLLDGLLPIDEFKDIFAVEELPAEEDYQTVGGFVMAELGRIPSVADHFHWGDLRFEVVDMDGNRVDKVLVSPPESRERREDYYQED